MERSFGRILAAFVCGVMLATSFLPSFGCAPGFDQAFFSYSMHPDFPLTKFAQGELGILEPSYARSYQVAAYRYLTGKPLNAQEQKAFTDMWKARLLNEGTDFSYGSNSPAVQDWLKARGQVTKTKVAEINTYRKIGDKPDDYAQFENCPNAAFRNAIKTLSDRIAKYGANSAYVKEWVNGQDNVFCHCGAGVYDYNTKVVSPEGPFPAELPANADSGLKADRAYQIAAAHFYAKMYDTANKEFLAIAQDPKSPWQDWGLLLAARCLIRKATLPEKIDKESLSQAAELLNQILKDPKLSSIHSIARGLLSFIDCQSSPDTKVTELAKAVLDPARADALRQNIYDYTFLLDKYIPDVTPDSDPKAKQKPTPIPDVLKQDDLSEWLFTFQDQKSAESKARALQRWQETHSLPWLIVVLNRAAPGDKEEQEVLAAARAVPPSSPGYLSVSYYLIDLLMKANKKDEAANELSKVLQAKMPPSAQNDFTDLQMQLSPTVAEIIKLSVRRPAGLFSDFTGAELPDDGEKLLNATSYPVVSQVCYVPEAADVLNYGMPLRLLKEAVFKSTAPASQKFDLVQAVWIRAVLLKQEAIALNLIPVLKSLKPQSDSLFDAYANAKSPADRQFAASVFILKNPGARPYVTPGAPREVDYGKIEDYGDNWWGSKGLLGDFRTDRTDAAPSLKSYPRFLSASDIAAAKQEVKALQTLGDAPNILSANVLAYAASHPSDARVPEALSRCVKATKFGKTNAKTGFYSKQAFHLLHQRYGSSAWASKTPYFYGGDG